MIVGRAGAACYEQARNVNTDDAEARYGLAMVYFLEGNYPEGFREYESRWETIAHRNGRISFAEPQWDGRVLADSRLLLWAEQGHGDTIQFIRYVVLAKQRAANVTLLVPPTMARLMT